MKRIATKAVYGNAPPSVDGVPVEPKGDPLLLNGHTWIMLVPVDDDENRLWEWCVTTGRVIRTR